MNMRPTTRATNQDYAAFLADRFLGKRAVSIRFDLNLSEVPSVLRDDAATKIARKFKNNLSRFFFGKAARRFNKSADMTLALHKRGKSKGGIWQRDIWQRNIWQRDIWHFHIVLSVPDHISLDETKAFTEAFVVKNYPLTVPSETNSRESTICYFEPTETLIGSQIYNSRFGLETVLIF